ncbi:hypothetical protein [Oleiharenicola lentus]|uniref:hypothetical protein n=1 Tax=Oleiharenicola lentus TaxID=2508720 RepID=UPI003F67C888
MSQDPNAEFDHTILDKIELSPIGALPMTPAYQDALKRLYAARQVYASANHKGGHVTARSLTSLPSFYANNLDALIAGEITDDALESSASIYDRYVQSLSTDQRTRAEANRLAVIGKTAHHRAKHGVAAIHDPMHTLFLVPGAGPNPGLPGNYLHGSVFHLGPDADTGSWIVQVHDSLDAFCEFKTPTLPDALAKLQEVIASAPFHLNELTGLDFEVK